MGIYEEIKYLTAKEHITLTKISDILRERKYDKLTLSNLSRKIKNQTIKFEEVREIADILGYDIKFEKRKQQYISFYLTIKNDFKLLPAPSPTEVTLYLSK